MSNLLIAGTTGTPLFVINESDYQSWLTAQTESVQNWLKNTGYKGKGLVVIPATDGSIASALMVVKSATEHFACGDVINKLPTGQYALHTDAGNVEAVAYSRGDIN